MSDCRGLARIAVPTWLLASFATAALAHGCIDLLGDAGIGGDAYATHAHGAVLPVALAALILGAVGLLRSALWALDRAHGRDLIANLGRRCGDVQPVAASIAVAAGAFATLIAMEFVEQRSALGHVVGAREALGGNAMLGLAILALVAAIVTLVGLRSVRVLLAGAIAAVGAVFFWIVAKLDSRRRGAIVRRSRNRADLCAPTILARCLGMRAPPLPAFV
jgi:hypothetical protein